MVVWLLAEMFGPDQVIEIPDPQEPDDGEAWKTAS
jgi:hypothetical protein